MSNGTEEKILRAALSLFVRKGFHGTSIDDIMSKVGMTKGAFYAHYSSKSSLFLRLIEEFKTRLLDEMISEVSDSEGNAIEKIYSVFRFLAKFAAENTDLCVFLTFLTTEMNTDVDFEPMLRRVYVNYQKFISGLIKQGVKQGVFRKDLDPDLAALTFMALHDGTLHQWVLHRQYIDGGEFVKTFRNIFVSGLVSEDYEG